MNKILRVFLKILLLLLLIPASLITILIVVVAGLLRPFSISASRKIAKVLPLMLWSLFHGIFKLSIKMDLPETPKGSFIVISNHLGASDFMLLNALNKYNFTEGKYVIKNALKYFPVFYQGCLLVDFLVVRRSFEYDRKQIAKRIQDFVKRKAPLWLMLYPEGHRATKEHLISSNEFCISKGLEPFEHVLCPRYKGFELICEEFKGSHVENVLDVTIHCCSQSAPSFCSLLFSGTVFEFKCDVRAVPLSSIANPRQFIEDSFRRKDQLITKWMNKQDEN